MRVDPSTFSPKKASGFIVLEGVNGAGKTTLQTKIAEFFHSHSERTILTREPGSTALGKTLRSLVLEHPEEVPCEMAELFIFAADRAQHVDKVIRPGMHGGAWVVSDRYYYSTVAFQGYGRGINGETIRQVTSLAIDGVMPDLVLLLDLDPAVGLARTQSRKSGPVQNSDSFEAETLEFHTRIRNGFLEIAKTFKENFAVLDANQAPDKLFEQTRPYLEALLKAPRTRGA
jgi:dTMP kinase